MIDQIESMIKRMRWKAHFFLNNNEKKQGRSETRNFWIQIETSSMPTERIR